MNIHYRHYHDCQEWYGNDFHGYPAQLSAQQAADQRDLLLWTSEREGCVKLRMGDYGVASRSMWTVGDCFARALHWWSDYTALSWKDGSQLKTLSYYDYYSLCRGAARSFLKLGLQPYHGVCIIGFNAPERVVAYIGAIFAGGIAVGTNSNSTPATCQHVASDCKANFLVVENNQQLEKVLLVRDSLPDLKAVIQYKGELKMKQPHLYTWTEFMELGQCESDAPVDAIIFSQKPNQCCSIVYTSGTTGQPKGVMLSHDNLTWTAFATSRHLRLTDPPEPQESVLSYLCLSHISAQITDIWLPMTVGGVTHFAQPDALKGSLLNTLREVRPTVFVGVPHLWKKMQETVEAVEAKYSRLRLWVVKRIKAICLRTNLIKMNQDREKNTWLPLIYRCAKKFHTFNKVWKKMGLDRCKFCFTGSASISEDMLKFFLSIDICLYQVYGMSETSGPHTICIPSEWALNSCGKEIPGAMTKLGDPDKDGNREILCGGRNVFMGYLNMPDKTAETLDSNGWLRTGDLGEQDENGFLYITGRIKELIITAFGKNIAPAPIEDAVKKALPLISNAMLIGDNRMFLTILLTVKCEVDDTGSSKVLTDEAVNFCKQFGSCATLLADIRGQRDPIVVRAIQDGIDRVNGNASSRAQRIKRWIILPRDFSIMDGTLGPLMKLNRPEILKMYHDMIEDIYL